MASLKNLAVLLLAIPLAMMLMPFSLADGWLRSVR